MSPHLKATLAVIGVMMALLFMWSKYKPFLEQGRKPPLSLTRLNDMKKQGVFQFSIKSIDDQEISLDKYRDKLIVLNFWASWCEPCIKEFPSFIKMIKHFKGDVVIIAISGDKTIEDLNNFIKAFKLNDPNFIVAWDKDMKIADRYGTLTLPESYIIKNNKIIRKVSGVEDWYTPEALSYFKTLIAQ